MLQVCSARNGTYGAVASMMTLARALRIEGHDVSFATFAGRGLGQHVREAGFDTHEFPVRGKIDPIAIVRMARHMRASGTQIVHCHLSTSSVNGSLAARVAGIPAIASVHGLSGKLSFLAAHHLIAVSAEVRRHLVAQGVHESKISIVPNGIDLAHYSESDRLSGRAKLGLPPDAPVLGTTARLTPLKGMEHALYAFARLGEDFPNARYVVFGDGEQRAGLSELGVRLGVADRIHWLGYRADVADLLPALDVFVFPTLREAMGIAIVEAMAAGVPPVASRIGGIPEVVTRDTGILVPPADPVALADAVASLLRDSELRKRMAVAGQERARTEFSAKRMAARTAGVYAAVLDRRGRA